MRIEKMVINVHNRHSKKERTIPVGSVAGARYASRDIRATRMALDRMISQGLPANRTNPSIFRIARYLLTQETAFEVQGPLTGGECEVVAIRDDDEIFITIGSDHCDRELHLFFTEKPKQMCPHPIASIAWPYDEVHDHWDSLRISSSVVLRYL
jgi:S-adenosylmethionine synthetase